MEIVVVGAERHPPYERPPVSKAILAGSAAFESAYLRPTSYYAEQNITLRLEARVESIDRSAGRVRLADGDLLDYATLVIATGARARTLPIAPAGERGIYYVRDIDDALALQAELSPGRRLAVIGGGFIGLEVAAAACVRGCEVAVVEAAAHVLARVVAPELAEYVRALHVAHGVALYEGVTAGALERRDGAFRFEAGDERLVADAIVVGVGAIPNVELAAAAGLAIENGIIVDEYGRTSDPQIYATGDVTYHYNPLLRRSLRLESWQNAQNQAVAVAHAIAGTPVPYTDLPWFWTDQYDANIQLTGAPERWDRIVRLDGGTEDKFAMLLEYEGRAVGGYTVNNAREMRSIKQRIVKDMKTAAANPHLLHAETKT